uniref:Uncharacterized protein n=1 Tax=Trichobilharzia regenti TaxID=157069 RepID=A0AA85J7D0_TRIRE|nr:unnamed protein product [Trichobilharzia regenti]
MMTMMMMKFCVLLLIIQSFTIFIKPSEAFGSEKEEKILSPAITFYDRYDDRYDDDAFHDE